MRWFLFLIVVLALLWYIRGIEESPPPSAEESVIGGPVKALRKVEGFEKTYLDANEEHKKKMDEQLDNGGP